MTEREVPIEIIDHEAVLELTEVCRICGVEREVIVAWVREGVVDPAGRETWRFTGAQVERLRHAGRLQRELEIENSALPLVLDLLEEIEQLRQQVRILRKQLEP